MNDDHLIDLTHGCTVVFNLVGGDRLRGSFQRRPQVEGDCWEIMSRTYWDDNNSMWLPRGRSRRLHIQTFAWMEVE